MEAAGIVECFTSSESDRNLHYAYYIGDGDSKSYLEVAKCNPYKNLIVQKLERVEHIQKELETTWSKKPSY